MSDERPISYRDAGVDIDAAARAEDLVLRRGDPGLAVVIVDYGHDLLLAVLLAG